MSKYVKRMDLSRQYLTDMYNSGYTRVKFVFNPNESLKSDVSWHRRSRVRERGGCPKCLDLDAAGIEYLIKEDLLDKYPEPITYIAHPNCWCAFHPIVESKRELSQIPDEAASEIKERLESVGIEYDEVKDNAPNPDEMLTLVVDAFMPNWMPPTSDRSYDKQRTYTKFITMMRSWADQYKDALVSGTTTLNISKDIIAYLTSPGASRDIGSVFVEALYESARSLIPSLPSWYSSDIDRDTAIQDGMNAIKNLFPSEFMLFISERAKSFPDSAQDLGGGDSTEDIDVQEQESRDQDTDVAKDVAERVAQQAANESDQTGPTPPESGPLDQPSNNGNNT